MRVLFLDLDTLRPDHLGCYGYQRNTSPNIDAIAKEGVTFTEYYCSDAPCLPSRSALMSGRFGIHTGAVGHGGTAADRRLEGRERGFRNREYCYSLPSLFRTAGMHTVAVTPFAERHGSWWFYEGFNEMHNTGRIGMESAEQVTPIVLDWIRNHAQEDNWYLHVNYWDAHTPYRVPEQFGNPFADAPAPAWLTEETLKQHLNLVGPHSALELNMYNNETTPRNPSHLGQMKNPQPVTPPKYPRNLGEIRNLDDFKKMIDAYDCGIRYMDTHVGQLFAALRQEGVFDDLAIIITSDHGENLGEMGIYAEHGTADRATCRIPMVIRWPNCKQGHMDNGLHYNLDLVPTLADLMEVKPFSEWDGRSYCDTLTSGAEEGRDYLVFSQMAHVCQRSVRFGNWLYIRTYHDGYHLFDRDLLFDIVNDPYEQHNLAKAKPEIVNQAISIYLNWHDQMMFAMEKGDDPLWTVINEGGPFHAKGHLARYCERLEATGRGWAIAELKKRHPLEFK